MYNEQIEAIIEQIKTHEVGSATDEGGYTNYADDPGGPTRWGVTERVARRHGYLGDMRDYSWEMAKKVYYTQYITGPRFDDVGSLSWPIAAELVDTGVNMGIDDAGKFLQRSLNALNLKGTLYEDLKVDGIIGNKTLMALEIYLEHRGLEGEEVMLKALNCFQGAKYLDLAASNSRFETFIYGWLRTRVHINYEGGVA